MDMFATDTTRTLAASLTALVLALSVFATGVAGETGVRDEQPVLETGEAAEDLPSTTNCLQWYYEETVGPVTVIYYCGLEAEYDEAWSPGDEVPELPASGDGPYCYDIYYQQEAGPVTYTATSSCDHDVEIEDGWGPGPSQAGPGGNGLYCAYVYYQQEAGPVTYTATSTCNHNVTVDDEWEPEVGTSAIPPCGTGSETTVGPATAGYDPYCNVILDVDEDWDPTEDPPKIPLSHMQPSDEPVKCFLTADSDVERWACFFGPPGP